MTAAPAAAGLRYGSADLQVHTAHGDGTMDARALFDRVEAFTDLDVVAVTDHDDVDYGFVVEHSRLVVDTRNATAGLESPGCQIVKA